jgi:hypothetical protein
MPKKSEKESSSSITLPPDGGTITTRVEQKQVEERVAIGAHVVYEAIP